MDEFLENFRMAFDPPPPLFRKIILRFFPQTGCAGTKFAMKFFRSEMTPPTPFQKFSGNSSILVETGFPKVGIAITHVGKIVVAGDMCRMGKFSQDMQ